MDLLKLQPLRDGIVVQLIDEPLPGIIIPPQISESKPHYGVVMSTGPGKRDLKTGRIRPVDVKPGDMVWFSLNDREEDGYALITEGDIGFKFSTADA